MLQLNEVGVIVEMRSASLNQRRRELLLDDGFYLVILVVHIHEPKLAVVAFIGELRLQMRVLFLALGLDIDEEGGSDVDFTVHVNRPSHLLDDLFAYRQP